MRQRVMGWVVLTASVIALVFSAVTGVQARDHAKCQQRINEQLVVASNARASAAAQDRDAIDRLIADVSEAKSPGDSRIALQRYRDTRAAADAERERNPLPAPPSQRC